MKPKKSPDKDLNRKRGFYFVLVLLLLLALLYFALEWKTEDDNGGYDISSSSIKEIELVLSFPMTFKLQ